MGTHHRSTILTVLVQHGFVSDPSGWREEIAPGGSTDRTFTVFNPDGVPRYTVRLARPGISQWLHHEEQVLRELTVDGSRPFPDEHVTAPNVPDSVACISDEAIPEGVMLVHEHVPGAIAALETRTVAMRERLGECLAWVHQHRREGYMIWPALDVRRGTRASAFRDRASTLERYESASSLSIAAPLIRRITTSELPASAGWDETSFALLHGDLSIGNILWDDGQVGLIDWEFARDGDPAEDLAYLVSEQQLSPSVVSDIAEGYVSAGGEPWAFARLPFWLPLVTLDAALWWADYWLARGIDPVTTTEVIERLKRLG